MKGLVKSIEGLPTIVKFVLDLFWGILGNLYRLCKSVSKNNMLGVVLAIVLLICGGFFILWIIDLVCIAMGKDLIWID